MHNGIATVMLFTTLGVYPCHIYITVSDSRCINSAQTWQVLTLGKEFIRSSQYASTNEWYNVTKQVTWLVITKVWSKSFGLVYRAPLLKRMSRVVMHFHCRVQSMFRHHPHHLGYLCAKFRFFHALHCWASPWRKIAYWINHSFTQLFWWPGNWSFRFGIQKLFLPVHVCEAGLYQIFFLYFILPE